MRGYPLTLSIEPTNNCNLSCPECKSGNKMLSRERGYLDLSTFEKVLAECSSTLYSLILYFQGEPFLHSGIIKMIELAHKSKVFTITSTNGQTIGSELARSIVKSGLDRIIFSMDGLDQLTYEKYRVGGDLHKVKEGIRSLVECKRAMKSHSPEVIIQFLILSHNQHQVADIREWGMKAGVDKVIIKTARIEAYEAGNPLIPEGIYSRYQKTDDGRYVIKNSLKNSCWRCWSKAVITWDGKVIPCCFDTNGDYVMGNIINSSFHDIWRGTPYKAFKKKVFRNRKAIPMCRNCTEGLSYFVH